MPDNSSFEKLSIKELSINNLKIDKLNDDGFANDRPNNVINTERFLLLRNYKICNMVTTICLLGTAGMLVKGLNMGEFSYFDYFSTSILLVVIGAAFVISERLRRELGQIRQTIETSARINGYIEDMKEIDKDDQIKAKDLINGCIADCIKATLEIQKSNAENYNFKVTRNVVADMIENKLAENNRRTDNNKKEE